MSILVTGGSGYIGSHVCVELLNAGYDVVVIDNLYNSHAEALRRVREITGRQFRFRKVDLLDRELLEQVFEQHRIDAVIHCAGLKAVGESVEEPLRYYHNNVTGTIILCEVMRKYGVTRMVFSSSATVYGVPEKVPLTEDCAIHANNPYGRTKQIVEDMLRDVYHSDQRWGIALLRYFNPIGAHVSGRIGEDPQGVPNNLVPYVTQVSVGRLEELKVFGNDYPTHDGTGIRDYIHVVDLAKGHLKALDKVMRNSGVNTYNLGTGQGYSVLDVIAAFERISGRPIPYSIEQRRPGDVAICYADPTKARDELGWVAEYDIERMCADSWRWQTNNPFGYRQESNLVLMESTLARHG